MYKKRYVPNLREMQNLAERNYVSALGLLRAESEVGETRQLSLGEGLRFGITVLTQAPYTTDIQVTQFGPGPEFLQARFVMRLYHDMRLAEMISNQGLERFAATYEQPNPCMHQRDEKRQINRYLADWFKLCFKRGRWHDVNIAADPTGLQFQVKR